jgi:serine/threonine protein kinase/tetratricopeptide (TPR) repeat protein
MPVEKRSTAFEDVQAICRLFRNQLKQSGDVSLGEYLEKIQESSREMLFQNLLHLEIEFRRTKGEQPNSHEYLKRFPQFASAIRLVFFESTMMSPETNGQGLDDTVTVHFDRPAAHKLDQPAARKLGQYELVRELGRGGFGVVYEARHLQRGDRVALKTLPTMQDGLSLSARDADRLHRFRREFRSLADVNHPNLVGMQSLEVDGEYWFFTMDLVDGVDFLDYVRPVNKLDIERLFRVLPQLVRGIIALHQMGIVHRDLKPSNVMVSRDGHLAILDFGLVAELQHLSGETLSMASRQFAGTPRYAAPEQIFGERTAAIDWYAVGTMLFEAITGEAPIQGSGIELMFRKKTDDPPRLAERSELPTELAALIPLIDELLQREPSKRPGDEAIANRLGVRLDSTRYDSSSEEGSTADSRAGNSKGSYDGELAKSAGSQEDELLIGRETQLTQLEHLFGAFIATGKPQVAFISGCSGEGKTSLANAFLNSPRRQTACLLLPGRCYDRESVPFKAIDCWIDPLVGFLLARPQNELSAWLPRDIPMLAQLFPVLRRVPSIAERCTSDLSTMDSRQVRNRAFAAFRELLRNVSRSTPLILFIDDLQWGDADSAAAMKEILASSSAPTAFFLGSYRSDEAEDSPFLTTWGSGFGADENSATQTVIEVGALSEQQSVALVAARLGIDVESIQRDQCDSMFQQTRGNPYFLEQIIEGYDRQTATFHPIPLQETIERKLSRLPSSAKPLLDVIAVSGQATSFEELIQVAELTGDVFSTITHMRSERLFRLIGSSNNQRIDTYHDKIRELIIAEMDTDQRKRLHVRFGDAIEKSQGISATDIQAELEKDAAEGTDFRLESDRIFDLAYHFHEAQDPRAFVYQLAAGELSYRAYALEDAVEFLLRAEQDLSEGLSKAIRFRLYQRLGRSQSRLNHATKAFAAFESAIELASTDLQQANIYEAIATTHRNRSQYTEAFGMYEQSLRTLGQPLPQHFKAVLKCIPEFISMSIRPPKWNTSIAREPNPKANLVTMNYIGLLAFMWEIPRGFWPYPYVLLASQTNSHRVTDQGSWCAGLSWSAGQFALNGLPWLGKWLLGKAATVVEKIDDDETRGVFLGGCAMVNHYSDQPAKADREYSEAYRHSSKAGNHTFIAGIAHMHRHLHAVIAPAGTEFETGKRAFQSAEHSGDVRGQCWGLYDMASGQARAGDLDAALTYIEAARLKLKPGERHLTDAIFLLTEGFVRLQCSAYESAQLSLEASWYLIKKRKLLMDVTVRCLPYLMESIVGPDFRKQIDPRVHRRLRRFCRIAAIVAWLYPNIASPAERARGRAFYSMGKSAKAIKCFRAAIKRAENFGAKYDLAKSMLDLAAVESAEASARRAKAVETLKQTESVIPYAERWLLDDQYDPQVVATSLGPSVADERFVNF